MIHALSLNLFDVVSKRKYIDTKKKSKIKKMQSKRKYKTSSSRQVDNQGKGANAILVRIAEVYNPHVSMKNI